MDLVPMDLDPKDFAPMDLDPTQCSLHVGFTDTVGFEVSMSVLLRHVGFEVGMSVLNWYVGFKVVCRF